MSEASWKIEGTMACAQRAALLAALQASSFRVSEAARVLRIGRSTIYRLIRVYEIAMPELAAPAEESLPSRTLVEQLGGGPTTHELKEPVVTLKDGTYYLSRT